jgi:hypothetical protein
MRIFPNLFTGDVAGADDDGDAADDVDDFCSARPEPEPRNSLPPAVRRELKSRSAPEEMRKTFCANS